MRVFIRTAELGSFSAVAREMELSQATVSKKIAALESHLGVCLISRTSRTQSLTEAGAEYHQRCCTILAELDEADAIARGANTSPSGTLRVSAPVVLGRLLLAPHLMRFLEEYPRLRLDLTLSDEFIDLVGRNIDLAIRAKVLEDTTLVARSLLENPLLLVASPKYLDRHGSPQKPDELKEHNCLVYSFDEKVNIWSFRKNSKQYSVTVSGNFRCDNGDLIVTAAESGAGIALLPVWMIHGSLASGQLIETMTAYRPDPLPIHAVYPKNRNLPLKTRIFIDFIRKRIKEMDLVYLPI